MEKFAVENQAMHTPNTRENTNIVWMTLQFQVTAKQSSDLDNQSVIETSGWGGMKFTIKSSELLLVFLKQDNFSDSKQMF